MCGAGQAARRAPRLQPLRGLFDDIIGAVAGSGDLQLVKPEQALKGRPTKMPGIEGKRHFVLGNVMEEVPPGFKVRLRNGPQASQ